MAKEHSFDIVSKVELHVLKDIVNVCEKTVKGRYDLKTGTNTIELNEKDNTIVFVASSDMAMDALKDIFTQAAIKRDVSPKAFNYGNKENAFSGNIRITTTIQQGIDKENAKIINELIKQGGFKVKSQIQDEQIRVTGKDIDTLQTVIAALRSSDKINIALQFLNFR
ncbi:MAG: YajQ family cyclic di-GMP-binding protein [Fusobacteria bacterium]|nr:YajQ family cyclic di-GMP-binding protein [Fusobacteriota bacterium]